MTETGFEELLDFLKRSRGFDFGGYKRTSLERRFRRRMEAVECDGFAEYLDYLEVHPEEFEALFDALLINVTEFFRDPPAWEHLRESVLPEVLAAKEDDEPVRVWSAGCATGQEAYSVAMLLVEALGDETYRERVKIYATDIDEQALTDARQAVYTPKEVEAVPADLRERYFERVDQRLAFRVDLRRNVIFGRNNLVSDAPISRLDLLICRNTLMYFTAEAQGRILRQFHFALRDHGALMLGKSEMMITHRDLFEAVDLKTRIFRPRPRTPSLQARIGAGNGAGGVDIRAPDRERATRDAAQELGPTAQIIVAADGTLTFANLPARALLRIGHADLGRPFDELEVSRQPAALRGAVEAAMRDHRRVDVGEVKHPAGEDGERVLHVTVLPLLADGTTVQGVAIVFDDVSRSARLQDELEGNRRDLEHAYEELQSTIDELETTNEELQSANEELQTTNEELQSTNEELETMNEELHSTNEELETINDELRDRTAELNRVNEFLEAILASLGIGVAVVDGQQRVQVWNHHAEELWGLREDEAIGRHLLSLDIGLPVERLAVPLRSVLGGASAREEAMLDAVNRRGRGIVCATTVLPLASQAPDGAVLGAIVLMEGPPPAERGVQRPLRSAR
jgi:two-component system, chemotaxis family, CheB/CheR fusion protein